MPSDGNSAHRTISLKNDFLTASGQGNRHELLSQALAGTVAPDQGASIILSSSQQSERDEQIAITQRRKRNDEQRLQLTLLDHARRLSKQLEQQIVTMEDGFEADMGDAWREQIANKVMNPDDIPERREGESMADYRGRLEEVLIATMIDPATGQIRSEYANDPEMRSYGEWAKAKHQKRGVDAYLEERSDPALSQTQKAAIDKSFEASATYANLSDARETLAVAGEDSSTLHNAVEDAHLAVETGGAHRTEAAAFPPPP